MEHINVLFAALGFLLCTLPIKYHEKNSKDKAAMTRNSGSSQVLQGLPAPTGDFILFNKLSRVTNKVQQTAKPSAGSATTATTATRETEMTLPMEHFKTDSNGNYLFVTRTQNSDEVSDPDEDATRKPYIRGNPLKPRGPSAQRRSYEKPDSTIGVCAHKSTIYNFPRQIRYLKPRIYHTSFPYRPVWLDLRQKIYDDGNSRECHAYNLIDWNEYINCAIRRNMRLEYLVPKYPLHQQGTYDFPRNEYFN